MAAFIQTRLCFRRTADFETKPKRAPIVSSIYHCCDGLWNLLYGQPVEFTDMKIRFVFFFCVKLRILVLCTYDIPSNVSRANVN